jgi:anti-anti-sigma factor
VSDQLFVERQGSVPVARLVGEIDISRAVAIRDALVRELTNQDYGMVVDLQGTTYLDSAGINVLFELAERLDGRQQKLIAVLPDRTVVRRVVELVNLESVMGVSDTIEQAKADIEALAKDASEGGSGPDRST